MTHVSLESTSPAPTSVVQPGQFRDILNPATGEVIATLPEHGEREVDAAVSAARRAFEVGPWPSMVRSDRAKLLLRIADAIENSSETLYSLETRNNGRPITETRAQLSRVPEWFRYNAGLLAAQRQAVLPGDGPTSPISNGCRSACAASSPRSTTRCSSWRAACQRRWPTETPWWSSHPS
ncbi:aldehyde dehydrogenase family protein [Mycolicibacterium peregrinum]|uniref:aldehyde dehydrogenase family protein n=1 Tax=Mycolicibacterium peregrinum TaxID=43304 RepID=UPI0021F26E72|nr:aldehyde dehydrogenase family protein [Mycolicibacterium peregrinum]